jgi:hypothetical protein
MRRVAGLNYRTLALGFAAVVLVGVILGSAGFGAALPSHLTPKSPAPAAAATPRASPVPAAQGQATTWITFWVSTSPTGTFPTNVTFSANITWGKISDTTTWVTLVVNGTSVTRTINASGGINAANVVNFDNNGIPTANYTWTVFFNQTTLACANPSCSALIGGNSGLVTFNISVKEAGQSAGGGWGSNYDVWTQGMVSTYATAGFLSPSTDDAAMTAYVMEQPMNISVAFWVNSSYVALSNATQNVWLQSWVNGALSPSAYLTFNNSLNFTLPDGGTGSITFNGTAGGVAWANVTYSIEVNPSALGYASWHAWQVASGMGVSLGLNVGVSLAGVSAGGIALAATSVFNDSMTTGTTLINGGITSTPGPYQPLPYTQTGWLNLSFVQPNWTAHGNASLTGTFFLWDLDFALLHMYTVNGSVNTVNSAGVSLTPVSNGTVAGGGPWVNYTWSVTVAPSDVAASAYGDTLAMTVNLAVTGVSVGGVASSVSDAPVFFSTFSAHPTTVAAVFNENVTGYIDVATAPFNLNFTLTVANGSISSSVTTATLAVVDATIPAAIAFYPIAIAPGQTSFSFPVDEATVATCTVAFFCPYTSPTDDFYFTLNLTENGVGAPTNGSYAVSTVSVGPAFFIGTPANITLLSPHGAGPTLTTGNITFATLYTGQYTSGANLTVYNSGNVPVFTASMTQLATGVPATAVWDATATGTYKVVASLSRTSGPDVYANSTLNIVPSAQGGFVFSNSSTYHNVTLLGHLSPAVAGTILLLVGLIVGMIVALLVGRMMWGGGGNKPQEPPQQWEQGSSSTSTSTTESSSSGGSMDSGTPPSGSS